MKSTTKTWTLSIHARLDGILVMTFQHTVSISGSPVDPCTAVIDGEAAPLAEAVKLLQWAREDGTLTEIAAAPVVAAAHPADPIGNRRAHALHVELGGRGYGRGYEVVSRILGYRITSLGGLVEREYQQVRAWLDSQIATVAA